MAFPKDRAAMITAGYKKLSTFVCRGCGEEMEFWYTPQGKNIPMNAMPNDDSEALSHFATCPEAKRFKKRGS
jgi:hypothetical protein